VDRLLERCQALAQAYRSRVPGGSKDQEALSDSHNPVSASPTGPEREAEEPGPMDEDGSMEFAALQRTRRTSMRKRELSLQALEVCAVRGMRAG
jgi:hypothetical protein